jgi:Leucine-rich repeat (LRR) protein
LENLPDSLQALNCYDNEITKLENLPTNLVGLNCAVNKITKLEQLPKSLKRLSCHGNNICKIENLCELEFFSFFGNPIENKTIIAERKYKQMKLKDIVTTYIHHIIK